jgi:hypothetical protein
LNIIGKDNLSAIFKMQSHTKYALNWDINNVWYANENEYPKLGGTIGEQVVISNNITTIEDLYFINYDLDGTFNLMNDLDFNNSNDYQNILLKDIFTSGTGWDPIGNAVDPNMDLFVGVFNGNGHVIKNLYINRPSSEETIGLFAVTNTGSLVEKLGLESVNIIGHAGVGSFAGQALSATIRDCYATGTIVADGEYVGGIVGVETESTIDRCYNTVNVTGNTYVGGLIGYMFNTTSGNVNNCFSVGNVTATATSGANYGRLIGLTFGTVSNSYYSNTSSITGNGTLCVEEISTTIQNLQALNQTGLNTWNTTTIWQVNSGAYPTLR